MAALLPVIKLVKATSSAYADGGGPSYVCIAQNSLFLLLALLNLTNIDKKLNSTLSGLFNDLRGKLIFHGVFKTLLQTQAANLEQKNHYTDPFIYLNGLSRISFALVSLRLSLTLLR